MKRVSDAMDRFGAQWSAGFSVLLILGLTLLAGALVVYLAVALVADLFGVGLGEREATGWVLALALLWAPLAAGRMLREIRRIGEAADLPDVLPAPPSEAWERIKER